jgi:hypothetical protein
MSGERAMSERPIQEQFGERVIGAFAEFARTDLKSVAELEKDEFRHVDDASLRRALAQVFYGSRWIYKLGLALLTKDEERAAHVRAQLVDYASVAEGLLCYCVGRAIRKGHTVGTGYQYDNPDKQEKPLQWSGDPDRVLSKRSFWWFIRVAEQFGVVDSTLEAELQWLREQRNTVHLRQRAALGQAAFLNQSKKAFTVMTRTILQTQHWRQKRA